MKTEQANLTENEVNLLRRLANNECADSSVFENPAWTFNVLCGASDNATFGSLYKKGFVIRGESDGDETYVLTGKAKEIL
jgi:hypothetical protein